MAEALLHIGTHKTGSTAFQFWARRSARGLAAQGVHLYEPMYDSASHYDVPMYCMRLNRTMGRKSQHPEHCLDELREGFARRFHDQVADKDRILVTAEALSLLRYEDELRRLEELLDGRSVRVAVVIRDQQSFLTSAIQQLHRSGAEPSSFPSSSTYFRPDSWVVRWDEMLEVWRAVFGGSSVVAASYEDAMDRYGSSVPVVIESLGLDADALPSWQGIIRNVTPTHQPRFFGFGQTMARRARATASRARSRWSAPKRGQAR